MWVRSRKLRTWCTISRCGIWCLEAPDLAILRSNNCMVSFLLPTQNRSRCFLAQINITFLAYSTKHMIGFHQVAKCNRGSKFGLGMNGERFYSLDSPIPIIIAHWEKIYSSLEGDCKAELKQIWFLSFCRKE